MRPGVHPSISTGEASPFKIVTDEHGIAVGIETVSRGHGFPVGGEDLLPPREGGDQKEQGGAGQVKVGNQHVHGPEPEGGVDEELRAPRGRDEETILADHGFQHARGGGPHGHDPPPVAPGVE